jgi:hypothetical protein
MTSPKTVFLFYTKCVDAEREDELSTWYDDVHIPDVEAIPGFTTCTRYHLTDRSLAEQGTGSSGSAHEATYLSIVEAEVGLDDAISRLREASQDWRGRGRMIDLFQVLSAEIVTVANPSQRRGSPQ